MTNFLISKFQNKIYLIVFFHKAVNFTKHLHLNFRAKNASFRQILLWNKSLVIFVIKQQKRHQTYFKLSFCL